MIPQYMSTVILNTIIHFSAHLDRATGHGVPEKETDTIKTAAALLDTLEKHCLLSRHNPFFLIWLLQKSKGESLAKKVESYYKESQQLPLEPFPVVESPGL